MELNRFLSKRAPMLTNSIRSVCEVSAAAESRESITVCELKGQALQLTSGLDFLSIKAYRLWMEHPSREKVNIEDEERLIMRESDVFGVVEAAEKAKPASA
jgi:hypothetical protein